MIFATWTYSVISDRYETRKLIALDKLLITRYDMSSRRQVKVLLFLTVNSQLYFYHTNRILAKSMRWEWQFRNVVASLHALKAFQMKMQCYETGTQSRQCCMPHIKRSHLDMTQRILTFLCKPEHHYRNGFWRTSHPMLGYTPVNRHSYPQLYQTKM
jgi:hypothetical protein